MLFLKYPERGAVKTRIASVLGDEMTLELYRAFLADLAVLSGLVKAQTLVVYSGPEGLAFPEFPKASRLTQRGEDIGDRMFNAFQDVFARGFDRSVLIGSDIPDLPAGIVNTAFETLATVDTVLGPCTDGGYYLVGCNRESLRRSIFSGVPWSTASVFAETLGRIEEAGLTAARLEPWSDIDDIDALKRYYQRNKNNTAPSHGMNFLSMRGIMDEL